MDYACDVLADSISETEVRITSLKLRLPRAAIWEDILTHRDFSRNASSSRATPVMTMIARATWTPEEWGLNQRGMGAKGALEGEGRLRADRIWHRAMLTCQDAAKELHELGIAKEDANLLLRPFEWLDAVITATRWDNFFWQRAKQETGPVRRQLLRVAEMMQAALNDDAPTYLQPGEWHLPFVTPAEKMHLYNHTGDWLGAARASAMRCARTSICKLEEPDAYPSVTQDADACLVKLVAPGHWSPLEHPCRALGQSHTEENTGNVDGWLQLRKLYPQEYVL